MSTTIEDRVIWVPVFGTAITLDVVTATMAIAVLKPWRRRYLEGSTA